MNTSRALHAYRLSPIYRGGARDGYNARRAEAIACSQNVHNFFVEKKNC